MIARAKKKAIIHHANSVEMRKSLPYFPNRLPTSFSFPVATTPYLGQEAVVAFSASGPFILHCIVDDFVEGLPMAGRVRILRGFERRLEGGRGSGVRCCLFLL